MGIRFTRWVGAVAASTVSLDEQLMTEVTVETLKRMGAGP